MTSQIWRPRNTGSWCVVAIDDAGHITDASGPLWPPALESIAGKDPTQLQDIEGDTAVAGALDEYRDDYNVLGAAEVLEAVTTAVYAKDQVIGPRSRPRSKRGRITRVTRR